MCSATYKKASEKSIKWRCEIVNISLKIVEYCMKTRQLMSIKIFQNICASQTCTKHFGYRRDLAEEFLKLLKFIYSCLFYL